MPKLIVKQDVSNAERQARRSKWVSVGGLFLLLVAVAAAAFFLTRPAITSPAQEPLRLESSADNDAKNSYISLHNVFNELSAEYESLSARGSDDYEKNLKLLSKSDSILRHLDKMQQTVASLGLNADEHKQLLNRQQFYKDYWQAKSHFRQLRVSRFEGATGAADAAATRNEQSAVLSDSTGTPAVPESDAASVATAEQPKKFRFAAPPPGMELPAGFCDLSNPDSCKPDTNAAIPLVEDVTPPASAGQPGKFKFATPPPGMELPEGFCDLGNPDSSCKPETAEAGAAVDQGNQTN